MPAADEGDGIVVKFQRALGLHDPRRAILELAKGKLTTAPEHGVTPPGGWRAGGHLCPSPRRRIAGNAPIDELDHPVAARGQARVVRDDQE